MGVNSQAYIFKKVTKNEISLLVSDIPGLKILEKTGNSFDSNSGEILVEYLNDNFWIHVFIRPQTDEYVRILPSYDNGFEESIKYIPNYGKNNMLLF